MNLPASEVYGATHLLRLLAKVHDHLNQDFAPKMSPNEIEGCELELKLFFNYLVQRKSKIFGEGNYSPA